MAEASPEAEEYLASVPEDRQPALRAVRAVVLEHLRPGFQEVVQYGGISWVVPLERLARTYNGQPLALATLADQKRHMALYLFGAYGEEGTVEWLRRRWAATGKKLDLGKSCLRFRRLDDLALDVIGEAIARTSVDDLVASHEAAHRRA